MPALANIYPALIGQVILAVLFTSVVSEIATEDLTFAGDFLNSRSFDVYFAISLIYLAIVWMIKGMSYVIERQFFKFAQHLR